MTQPRPKARTHARRVAELYLVALLKRPWLLTALLVSIAGLQFAQLVGPLYLKQLFNIVASSTPSPETATTLMSILGALAVIYVGEWAMRRISTFTIIFMESRAMAELSETAFGYLMGHSQHFFSSQFTGSLTRRVRKFS